MREAVRRVIRNRFERPAGEDWVIRGDFNDYRQVDGVAVGNSGLGPLLDPRFAVDMASRAIRDPLGR